jgi:hypothetical protein
VIVQVYSSGGFKRESISSAAIKIALGPAPRTLGATPRTGGLPGQRAVGGAGLSGLFSCASSYMVANH